MKRGRVEREGRLVGGVHLYVAVDSNVVNGVQNQESLRFHHQGASLSYHFHLQSTSMNTSTSRNTLTQLSTHSRATGLHTVSRLAHYHSSVLDSEPFPSQQKGDLGPHFLQQCEEVHISLSSRSCGQDWDPYHQRRDKLAVLTWKNLLSNSGDVLMETYANQIKTRHSSAMAGAPPVNASPAAS